MLECMTAMNRDGMRPTFGKSRAKMRCILRGGGRVISPCLLGYLVLCKFGNCHILLEDNYSKTQPLLMYIKHHILTFLLSTKNHLFIKIRNKPLNGLFMIACTRDKLF